MKEINNIVLVLSIEGYDEYYFSARLLLMREMSFRGNVKRIDGFNESY